MPSYCYHLNFELYPSSSPHTPTTSSAVTEREPWLPPPGSDIFCTQAWPHHPHTREGGSEVRLDRREYEYLTGKKPAEVIGGETGKRGAVIDCGVSRAADTLESNNSETVLPVLPVLLGRSTKLETSHTGTSVRGLGSRSPLLEARDLSTAVKDWRFGLVRVESVDMESKRGESSSVADGILANLTEGAVGRVTKARFEEGKRTDIGWGVVHLFRDGEETPALNGWGQEGSIGLGAIREQEKREGGEQEDCTTLCIPAVPSYLSPSDFLGFVGEKTREQVSHFRMVMTGRMNRYLVLMKFRDSDDAKQWKAEWDGTVFNSVEPEACHVVFIKSITFQTPNHTSSTSTSFPELSHDPFTPSPTAYLKPFPPPTPSLVELPTCPVCLERMDDTTGLLTILCQHVFHCDCLQKWRGSGCPVCRATNPSLALQAASPSALSSPNNPCDSANPPFGSGEASLCSVCDCTDDLWICLICGNVGCGRYKGGHAKEHWKEAAHNFALEIETQHVWDYAEDTWVHRLIREKGDSKVIELPSSRSGFGAGRGDGRDGDDMVPREKLERIGMEYTHLLTSQLESQRVYFEELVGKAVAKASAASSAAALASNRAEEAMSKLGELQRSHAHLKDEVVVGLEKDLAREKKKAEKASEMARGFGKSLREEKKVNEGLMERIEHVNGSMASISTDMGRLKEENEDLKEQNRDLLFSITAQEKLKDMEGVEEGELEGGMLSLPAEKRKGRKGKK